MAYFSTTDNSPSKFLSGVGFQFSVNKLPGISYYCQSVSIPSINLATATQATRWRMLPEPGDELNYDDLSIRFLVDEDLKNYMSIHNWMRYLGAPESEKDWTTFKDGTSYNEKQFSDGSIWILDSNFKKQFEIAFDDLFPVSLGSLNFNASYTDTEYFTIDATFKYSIFDIKEVGKVTFFSQSQSYITPTVTLAHTLGTNDAGKDVINLTYTSTNAVTLLINNGVGVVPVTGNGVTILVEDIQHLTYNGVISYQITATSKDNIKATATTVVTTPVVQTSENRTCIAIIDESSSQSYQGMEAKWVTFRQTYPDRVFWLLQATSQGEGSTNGMYSSSKISDLQIPPSFLEETDPAKADL